MRPTLFPTLRLTDGKILIVEPAELAGRQVVRVDGRARVALANGTGRTVHHRHITVEPT